VASAPNFSSQSPQFADVGRLSSRSIRGIAYTANAVRSSSVRAKTTACASSSSTSSEILSRTSLTSPSIRRRHRSRSPITAASTSRRSQRRGALSCPSRTEASSASVEDGSNSESGDTQRSLLRIASGGAPSDVASGTCPSERYSANLRADRPSAAHLRSAQKARPAGSGQTAPRAK
jgi:hypothetical protein